MENAANIRLLNEYRSISRIVTLNETIFPFFEDELVSLRKREKFVEFNVTMRDMLRYELNNFIITPF